MPEENLLGEENQGFYLIMANFQWERLMMALGAVGGMQRMLRAARAVPEGAQGVRPARSAKFQAIRHKFAEMAHDASRPRATSPTTRCACSSTARTPIREVTMAKLATQRAAFEVADDAACSSTAAPAT